MPPRYVILPTLETDLQHYPWIVLRFRCDYCKRWADGNLAACAAKFGAETTLGELIEKFMAGCPWRPDIRKPQKYGRKCGAYMPDLRSGQPPDLPPFCAGLTVIEGGKDDLPNAEPPVRILRRPGGKE